MKIPDSFILVDDDPTNNMISGFVLERLFPGLVIESFTIPEQALEAIKEKKEQAKNASFVLFLDINMPSMTGWEFLDEFKDLSEEIHNCITIYILSSSVNESDKEKAESNPFVSGFLSKPLQEDILNQIFNGKFNLKLA